MVSMALHEDVFSWPGLHVQMDAVQYFKPKEIAWLWNVIYVHKDTQKMPDQLLF